MTYEEILDQLEDGEVRSANQLEDGRWEANIEVKQAILCLLYTSDAAAE